MGNVPLLSKISKDQTQEHLSATGEAPQQRRGFLREDPQ